MTTSSRAPPPETLEVLMRLLHESTSGLSGEQFLILPLRAAAKDQPEMVLVKFAARNKKYFFLALDGFDHHTAPRFLAAALHEIGILTDSSPTLLAYSVPFPQDAVIPWVNETSPEQP